MNNFRYNVVFKPEPEGGFTVIVPSLPGCVTYGKDLNEAKKMAKDAIKCYVASLKKHKDTIPNDSENFLTSIDIMSKIPVRQKLKYA
ncbi:MAG: type II toxin-antitoxin system HicB family antitoxin [Candidatus Falkowbacteria bacterium]